MAGDDAIREFQRTGDETIFRELVLTYQKRVFWVALSVLGPGGDAEAEEVTQEAFLAAFRHAGQLRDEGAFAAWLCRIAFRIAVDRRKLARRRMPHLGEDTLSRIAAPADTEAGVLAAEQQAAVREAVGKLPDLYRAIVHQYYWLELPLEEIGTNTGIPVGTLKSYLARAREQIRGRLAWKKI
ncbi:MAG: RNA polymerase sigma factor [Bryobacteraceae bacterium]|nr:RNA polymerase sigma factor [Bryobacteraceae bacterium]